MKEYITLLKGKAERAKIEKTNLSGSCEAFSAEGIYRLGYLSGRISILDDAIYDLELINEKAATLK